MAPVAPLSPLRRRGRPPKDGAGLADTRAALVRAGLELLTEHGLAATGIDRVVKTVGVPKGSFYHYFPSKDGFALAVVDAYGAYFAAKLDRHLTDGARAPLDRLRGFVADARAGMIRHQFRRGCLIGNLGQDLGGDDELLRRRLDAVLTAWQDRVADCLRQAVRAGEVAADTDAPAWAAFFWIGWEGAILRAKMMRGPQPLDLFADSFFALLQGKGPTCSTPS